MPKLTINDMEIEVEPGTSILQAAEQLGVEVPRFCYHDRLSVPANCRMCLVEVEGGPPKPVASCAMACGEGMVVKTESEMVKKARKGVMEMMLINHPLDCPICDQGGECDLQDQAVGYGFDRSRYHENKRAVPDKDLGPLIKTVMTRCINCTRCVRFAEEVAGTPVMGQLNRGEEAEIGTFVDELVKTELSGNLIDICPVGALTSAPYAFKARSWELRKTETIDVHDALGCNIRVDARGREVMRILPRLNEDINEEWINDRSRFTYDGLNEARLDRPYVKDAETKKLREASWEEAFDVIASKLKRLKGEQIAALAGDLVDTESMTAMKDLMVSLGSENCDCRTDGAQMDVSNRAGYLFNSGIAALDEADAVLLIGVNPRWEGSLVNTRIHRAVKERRVPVGVVGEAVDLGYDYVHVGDSFKHLESMVKDHAASMKSEKPIWIVGSGVFAREDGAVLQAKLMELAEKMGVVTKDWNGFSVLQAAASRVGALDIGFVPGAKGKGFAEICEGTKSGDIKAVFLLGADEFDVKAALGAKPFVVYIGHHGDHGAMAADVILPGCAYTEKEGLYVNTEGRPQVARKAVTPPGDAREDWKILRALSEALGKALPYNSLLELRERMVEEWPHLAQIGQVRPATWSVPKAKGSVVDAPFVNAVQNFYLTNAICRASKTMHACVDAFAASAPAQKIAAE